MSSAFESDVWGADIDWRYEARYTMHTKGITLWPLQWETYADSHDWTIIKLEHDNRDEIPITTGIYTLILQPGIANHLHCSYLMYVGRTEQLRDRFLDYVGWERGLSGRGKMRRFLMMYNDYIYFCYTLLDRDQLIIVEENLKSAYIPWVNEKFEGMIGVARGAWR